MPGDFRGVWVRRVGLELWERRREPLGVRGVNEDHDGKGAQVELVCPRSHMRGTRRAGGVATARAS
jgi:hypothetical protein